MADHGAVVKPGAASGVLVGGEVAGLADGGIDFPAGQVDAGQEDFLEGPVKVDLLEAVPTAQLHDRTVEKRVRANVPLAVERANGAGQQVRPLQAILQGVELGLGPAALGQTLGDRMQKKGGTGVAHQLADEQRLVLHAVVETEHQVDIFQRLVALAGGQFRLGSEREHLVKPLDGVQMRQGPFGDIRFRLIGPLLIREVEPAIAPEAGGPQFCQDRLADLEMVKNNGGGLRRVGLFGGGSALERRGPLDQVRG